MREPFDHVAVYVPSTGEWFFPAGDDALAFFYLTREDRDHVAAGHGDYHTQEILDSAIGAGRRKRVHADGPILLHD
jgi:hypothetical protein